MERKILFVDSDQESREKADKLLNQRDTGLEIETVGKVEEVGNQLEDHAFNVVITEAELADGGAGEVLDLVDEKSSDSIKVLFTERSFEDIEEELIVGAEGYLLKSEDDAYEKLFDQMESLMQDRSELPYPTTEDEEGRLREIDRYDVEAMMASDDFDGLTEIGAELFDVDFCFLGIVEEDEEQFLSFQGSDTEELERECTICTFAINQDDIMEVENTETDPRFKYVDALHDLGIKWYAGMPIVTENGHKIGSFCISDGETRQLSEREAELLRILAQESMEKIELKYRKDSLKDKVLNLLR